MSRRLFYWLLFLILFAVPQGAAAQQDSVQPGQNLQDSVFLSAKSKPEVTHVHTTDSVLKKKHSPKIAIALSLVVPGAGQIYNKKAWKVPIIYTGFLASGFCTYYFNSKRMLYQTEYKNRMQGNTSLLKPQLNYYSDENILSLEQKYQQYMEISIAAIAIVYLLNVIDAAVDAHLYYFDISDDLSMRMSPYYSPDFHLQPAHTGISFAFKLK